MVGELLLKKALLCRDRIAKIRRALPANAEDIVADERAEAFIAFNLFLLIQDMIDLAAHLIAARGLGLPTSHRESFDILTKAAIISPETASAMGAMASLRNRLAHTYGDIDPIRLAREAPYGLDWADRFLNELAAAVSSVGP